MTANNRGGISFAGALQIAFIVLKLMNVIKWSWFWVLAPTWVGLIVFVAAVAWLYFHM